MELRHLRYFVAVAATCHFGRAAEELHIAQPALSQAIRQLENELGTSLMVRTTRQARLTPAGEHLQREAKRILDSVDDAVDGVRRIASGHLGVLRLGLTGTAAVSQLPEIARTINHGLNGLSLDIHADLLTPTQCDALREGRLDLGVLRPPTTGTGIATRTIAVEQLRLALPADHPLAAETTISMHHLREYPFVMYDKPNSAVNLATIRSCESASFAPQHVHRAPDTPVMLSLVSAGLGVALVPGDGHHADPTKIVFREVVDAQPVEVALAWRVEETAPLVLSVIELLSRSGFFAQQPVAEASP